MRQKTARRLACLAACLAILLPAAVPASEPAAYTVGVVPRQAAVTLARLWGPLLRTVETRAGVTLVFETASDIPAFERGLAEGRYGFAYMNPYRYPAFSRVPGYRAFAKHPWVPATSDGDSGDVRALGIGMLSHLVSGS